MSKQEEVTDLFTRLALNIRTHNSTSTNVEEEEDPSIGSLISNLNQSLNLGEQSRVRVLDAALSLMCFTAPQVFDSVIECSVKTIVSVLSSLINCKVIRIGQDEILRVGGSISCSDCTEVMDNCVDILGKLKQHGIGNSEGTLSCALLHAVVRVVASATGFRNLLQLTPILEVKPTDAEGPGFSKLFSHIPKRISLKTQEIPLRLLCWYLDPHTLKHDVSQILHEATRRPFLCLSVELYERMEWRSFIIYLVLSPAMFVETRSLLHNWFLMTGLASVLELQTELASLVLDVLSRPMWWGISAEVGSMLPYSHAYFPYKHHLFGTFAGPLSCGRFLQLVHSINKPVFQTRKHCHPSRNHAATRSSMVDQKSIWAMAISFPDWFYLASILLFFGENFQDRSTSGAANNEQSHSNSPSYSAAASKYIAWILDPIGGLHQDSLPESLNKLSVSLHVKQSSSDIHDSTTSAYKKKSKKPKRYSEGDETSTTNYQCQAIRSWLKEFQDVFISYYTVSVKSLTSHERKQSQGIGLQHNLFRRVSLGILIGCPNLLSNEACESVLHYAATGTVLPPTENQITGTKHRRWNFEQQQDHVTQTDNFSRKEAVAGACTVFHLTDVVESISGSLFETEESGVDFICRMKLRVGKYLLKCVKRLLRLEIDEDVIMMLKDLYNRLLRWKYQGKDVFQGSKDLDNAISTISSKLIFLVRLLAC